MVDCLHFGTSPTKINADIRFKNEENKYHDTIKWTKSLA